MSCILWMWISASAGACLGFLMAAMFRVASDADDQMDRWNDEQRS